MERTSQASQQAITIVGGIFSQVCALAKQKELEALKKRLGAKKQAAKETRDVAQDDSGRV